MIQTVKILGCASNDAKYLQMSRCERKLHRKDLLESDTHPGPVSFNKLTPLISIRFAFDHAACFNTVANFRVSLKLKGLYSNSVQVPRPRLLARDLSFNQVSLSNTIQMVYVDKSANYCDKNQKEGSQGTRGR